jgi:hypothetical protein
VQGCELLLLLPSLLEMLLEMLQDAGLLSAAQALSRLPQQVLAQWDQVPHAAWWGLQARLATAAAVGATTTVGELANLATKAVGQATPFMQ